MARIFAQKIDSLIATGIVLCLAASLALALSGCIKQASDDADILEDAGTSSGAAIVLDPDEEAKD